MNICMIGCWYKDDLYSHSCYNLIQALKTECNIDVRLVTSNCGCFTSAQRFACTKEELVNTNCAVINIPYAPPSPSKKYGLLKYYAVKVLQLNTFLEISRGFAFYKTTKDYDLIHFDQVLKSFGFLSFITLLYLSGRNGKKIVVTVHEIDPLQERHRNLNRFYNKADRIIVHSQDLKNELIRLGVKEEKIEVIPFGVTLESLKSVPRDQFIFFGGHRLFKGKGFDTLLNAMKIIKSKGITEKLIIYVGEGCVGLEEGKKVVHDMGLDDTVIWSNFLSGSKLSEAYQKSIACVLPYTGGSGRYPVTSAMANATPVIATRKASLPEYLGDLGVYIKEDSPEELAAAMMYLISNKDKVNSLGGQLRKRVAEQFSWEVIAKKISNSYKEIAESN